MTTYTATIMHSSISRAREITVTGTLEQAKAAADAEFGAEQIDYEIVVRLENDYLPIVASRLVSARRWNDFSL